MGVGVWGLGFGVWSLWRGVQDFGFGVWDEPPVKGEVLADSKLSENVVPALQFRLRISGFGSRVS